jgi:hypothetical protein
MDKKTEATINQLCHQRNREADAVARLCGEIAAWQERWDDVEQVRARLAKLEGPPDPRSGE